MKKTLFVGLAMCMIALTSMAQNVQEPQFIGDVQVLTSDSTVLNLEKKTGAYKSKAGISMKLTGFGSVKTRLHVEGDKATTRITLKDHKVILLVRAANNNSDPSDFISVFKFEQKKKERRAEMASVNTFGGSSTNNFNYIPYNAKKFGESSYLLYLDITEPCEMGVMVSNPDENVDKQLIVRCLGIDK